MTKLALALGCALAAVTVTVAASAQTAAPRVEVRRTHHGFNMDADGDGWLTRAEAATGAERAFTELDRNRDGRVSDADFEDIRRAAREARETARAAREQAREAAQEAREAAREAREAARERAEAARERAEATRERGERGGRHVERHVVRDEHGERQIIIIRGGGPEDLDLEDLDIEIPPIPPLPHIPPVPPVPPQPPAFMMMFGHAGEADLDGDGGLSLQEFRDQQLRFFDAADANRDGRIRFERIDPPEPPQPPAPPPAPEPPRRR